MEHPMSSYRTRYRTFHYVTCLPSELDRRTHCVCTRQLHHAMLAGAFVLSPYLSHHSPCAFISRPINHGSGTAGPTPLNTYDQYLPTSSSLYRTNYHMVYTHIHKYIYIISHVLC